MKLVFTKGAGKFDRLEVLRDGQAPELIECPKQRIIPHDMVHYAVETVLQERGFLTRVRDGEAASFQMQSDPRSDAIERLVEVFQGDAWSGGNAPASEMLDLYELTCDARACPMLPVDEAAILAVRAAIAQLTARWEAVAIGAALTLAFAAPDVAA